MKRQQMGLPGHLIMCRNYLFFPLFVLSMMLSLQVSGQMVAVLDSEKDFLRSENGQFQTVFIIETDKAGYKNMIATASNMPETFSLPPGSLKRINISSLYSSLTLLIPPMLKKSC